jgi:hypothetical protein
MTLERRVSWAGQTTLDDRVHVGLGATSKADTRDGGRRKIFYRRPRDIDGLSVMNRDVCEPPQIGKCIEQFAHRCYAVATLRIADIRNIEIANLDVKPDEELDPRHFCDHAVITGLPFQSGENADPALAEELAIALQDQILEFSTLTRF